MGRAGWILLCCVCGASGCVNGGWGGASPTSTEELAILWQEYGTYSRAARRMRIVARDAATLSQIPLADVPVDFRDQMVLIATLGPVRSDEYGIRITRVWREGKFIKTLIRVARPAGGQAKPLVLASPYHVVIVPKSGLNVVGFSADVPSDAFDFKWMRPRR